MTPSQIICLNNSQNSEKHFTYWLIRKDRGTATWKRNTRRGLEDFMEVSLLGMMNSVALVTELISGPCPCRSCLGLSGDQAPF